MLDRVLYGDVTLLNLVTAMVVFVFSMVFSKLVVFYLKRSLKDKIDAEHLEIITKVLFYGIILLAILWILPTIGVEFSSLLVAGGIVGLAIGFASQSIVGNLISGLFLMGERPVKKGDLVEIDDNFGFVEDIHIISTVIRTLDGIYVRVPNETVFTSSINNYSSHAARRFAYEIGIRYSDDADKAVQIIRDVIDEHPLTLVHPAPHVFVDNLGDNSVNIIVRIWAPTSEWYGVKMELLWKMKQAIEAQGIQVPFPQRVVWYGADEKKAEVINEEEMPSK